MCPGTVQVTVIYVGLVAVVSSVHPAGMWLGQSLYSS